MLLRSTLHLYQKRLAVLSLTQHIEDCLSVVLHYPELLRRDIRDIRNRKLWKNHLKEFDKNVLVHLCSKNTFETPIDHQIDVLSLDDIRHKIKKFIWFYKNVDAGIAS